MSNNVLVHVSCVHCHVRVSFTSGHALVYFTVQYCRVYSSAASLFQAQSVQTSVKAAAMQLVVLAGDLG